MNNSLTCAVHDKVKNAWCIINDAMDQGQPLSIAYSGGKDSSVVMSLIFEVAAHRGQQNPAKNVPQIFVTHADTLIENPEIAHYVRSEIKKIENWAAKLKLPVSVKIAYPNLGSQFAVKVIGGRALPSFPNSNRDCTVDLKIRPQMRLHRKLEKEVGDFLTVTGTRFQESTSRKIRMVNRGEVSDRIWENDKGKKFLSPIADWTTQDIWSYLDCCRKARSSYSDFQDTIRLYQDADSSLEEVSLVGKNNKALGSRFGCYLCCATKDLSLETMIKKNPERYGYMAGINKLQKFLRATQYDFDRRDWLGRTVDEDGYLVVRPDVYSPAMLEELLLYCLTIDAREEEACSRLGIYPRFQIISPEAIVGIEALWSLYGRHKPFHAFYLWHKVHNHGDRYDIPEIDTKYLPAKIPDARYYHVGHAHEMMEMGSAFRDFQLEMVAGDHTYCRSTKILSNGVTVMDCETEDCFSVDPESVFFLLEPTMGMLDDFLKIHEEDNRYSTVSYTRLASLGVIQIAKGKEALMDKILRRSIWKHRNGLKPGVSYKDILCNCVSKKPSDQNGTAGQLNLLDYINKQEHLSQMAV